MPREAIVITRGNEKGQHYLSVKDDGEGVRRNAEGEPTSVTSLPLCDSIKRRLKTQGTRGLQGEFGIGLLSFWTLGEELTADVGGRRRPRLADASSQRRSGYRVTQRPALFPDARNRGVRPRHPAGHPELSGERSSGISPPNCATGSVTPAFDPRRRSDGASGSSRSSRASSKAPAARARAALPAQARSTPSSIWTRIRRQCRLALSFRDARARRISPTRSLCPHAVDERLRAGHHRCAVSQSDAGDAAWRHSRCRARAAR